MLPEIMKTVAGSDATLVEEMAQSWIKQGWQMASASHSQIHGNEIFRITLVAPGIDMTKKSPLPDGWKDGQL